MLLGKNQIDLKNEEYLKDLGDSIIDAILDDDPSSKYSDFTNNPNLIFKSHYKLPTILRNSPPILCVCCLFGSINCFRTLIDLGADPFAQDDLKYTTAHFVAFSGNLDIARDLYKLGVNFQSPAPKLFQYMPFLPNNDGFYPQHIAAMNGQQELINWLWLKGNKIDKSLLIYSSAYGNLETIKFLFDTLHFFTGDDQDSAENEDIIKSSLNSAAVNGQDKVLAYLLDAFHNVSMVEPLIYSAKNGSLNCVKLCMQRQKEEDDIEAWDAFLYACSSGYLDIVYYFIRSDVRPTNITAKTINMPTPLECAVNNDHYDVAEALISSGYVKIEKDDQKQVNSNNDDQNELNSDDSSFPVIHYFFDEKPNLLLDQATLNNNMKMIKLIVSTFNIDVKCLCNTANIAINNRNLEITDYYVSQGVPLRDLAIYNFFLMDKKSPATLEKERPFVEYFISKGALEIEELPMHLVYAGDVNGLINILNRGAELNESYLNKNVNQIIKEILIGEKYGMLYFLLDNYNLKVTDKMLLGVEISDNKIYYDVLKKFIDKGISLSTPKNGCSLLYYAIINYNIKAIELLKENGADYTHVAVPISAFESPALFNVLKDIIDSENDFSKCIPKCEGKDDFIVQVFYNFHNSRLVKFLISINFIDDINQKFDDDGSTLLDFALYNEDTDMINYLLLNGASLEYCCSQASEFLELAKASKNKNLMDLIQKKIDSYCELEED